MAPGSFAQDQFGGGIFRGRRAPADSVYDAVNGLVSDERELFRRAGSTYKSTSNAGATLIGAYSSEMTVGRRTIFWDSGGKLYALDGSNAPYTLKGDAAGAQALMRTGPFSAPVAVGGLLVMRDRLGPAGPLAVPAVLVYGGGRKGYYNTGTATRTNGSKTITGIGTTWVGNVEVGQVFPAGTAAATGIVASVDSNTQITLRDPWHASSGTSAYEISDVGTLDYANQVDLALTDTSMPWAIGSVATRLLVGFDNRLYFSSRGTIELALTDYHELPQGSRIIGITSIRDTAIVFTTAGVWAIANMALDLLDDVGNVQHQVSQISQDMILWGDQGIAAWAGTVLVAARDDVYLMADDGPPVALSAGVRPLLREYVQAGYRPGVAAVSRGHLFLPVVNSAGTTLIDTLVCRLDLTDGTGQRRPAWTRWADHAASTGYGANQDELLGVSGQRVTTLLNCFDPDATRKADADGTNHALTIISNDVDTGPGLRGNTVLSADLEYELVDAASDNPTCTLATATGAEGASFTMCTLPSTGGTSGPEGDGTTPVRFDILRKVERIRWRWQTSGAAASAILRRIELKIRQGGRQ